MRGILFLIFVFFFSFENICQQKNISWDDTTFLLINLQKTISPKKIIAIDIGEKASIYVEEKNIRKRADKQLKNDFTKDAAAKVLHVLNSSFKNHDTAFVDRFLPQLDYYISEELQNGNAAVFYKKENAFVKIIYHRLEKYGMYAHRFFYLPDRRPFFSTMEFSGILEDGKYFSDPDELIKLGEKLQSLNKK